MFSRPPPLGLFYKFPHRTLMNHDSEQPVIMAPNRGKLRVPFTIKRICCIASVVFLGVGILVVHDLMTSRAFIIAERSALAVQTSRFMSQQFGTTITAADYVLRDMTTKVTVEELDLASSEPEVAKRLSAFSREKLATLPGVYGLSVLDHRAVFVGAADESLVGVQSNSKLHVAPGQTLDNKTYIEYVPHFKSANKQPAILVSRPILSSEGRMRGGALAAIMLSSAQDWIETFHINQSDTMALVDQDGVLLASNPRKPETIGKVLKTPPGLPRLGDQSDSAAFIGVSPLDGHKRIYGVSKVEHIPLSIIVGYDEASCLREWRQRAWQAVVGFATLLWMLWLLLSHYAKIEALKAQSERKNKELQEALENIKTLKGMIPICASCKKIRDDEGYWQDVAVYVRDHSEAEFSHGICPDCMAKLYPEY
jgi:hypothetical protein